MIIKFMITFCTIVTASMAVFSLLLFGLIDHINEIAAITIASAASVFTIISVDKLLQLWKS